MSRLDGYHIITNLTVEYAGKSSELDAVVIGKNGIFIIEIKNYNGTITGRSSDKNWVQHKVGRRGGEYSNNLYNPIKQVGTQVYRLANYLRANNYDVWVQGIVFFSNTELRVNIVNDNKCTTPVFLTSQNGESDMLKFISQYSSNRNNMHTSTVEKIVNQLM